MINGFIMEGVNGDDIGIKVDNNFEVGIKGRMAVFLL